MKTKIIILIMIGILLVSCAPATAAQESEVSTESPLTQTPVTMESPTEGPNEPLLACVTLLAPMNDADIPPVGKVTFSWTPMDEAGSYVLNIILPSGETFAYETDQTFSDFYMEAFIAGGEYRWRVIAQNTDGSEICISKVAIFNKSAYEKPNAGDGGNAGSGESGGDGGIVGDSGNSGTGSGGGEGGDGGIFGNGGNGGAGGEGGDGGIFGNGGSGGTGGEGGEGGDGGIFGNGGAGGNGGIFGNGGNGGNGGEGGNGGIFGNGGAGGEGGDGGFLSGTAGGENSSTGGLLGAGGALALLALCWWLRRKWRQS